MDKILLLISSGTLIVGSGSKFYRSWTKTWALFWATGRILFINVAVEADFRILHEYQGYSGSEFSNSHSQKFQNFEKVQNLCFDPEICGSEKKKLNKDSALFPYFALQERRICLPVVRLTAFLPSAEITLLLIFSPSRDCFCSEMRAFRVSILHWVLLE